MKVVQFQVTDAEKATITAAAQALHDDMAAAHAGFDAVKLMEWIVVDVAFGHAVEDGALKTFAPLRTDTDTHKAKAKALENLAKDHGCYVADLKAAATGGCRLVARVFTELEAYEAISEDLGCDINVRGGIISELCNFIPVEKHTEAAEAVRAYIASVHY